MRRDVLAAADGHLALPLASVARLAHALGLVPAVAAVAAAAAAPLSDTTNPSASVPIEHKKTLPSKRKKKTNQRWSPFKEKRRSDSHRYPRLLIGEIEKWAPSPIWTNHVKRSSEKASF